MFEVFGFRFDTAIDRFVGVLPDGGLVEDVDVLLLTWSAHYGLPFHSYVERARRSGQVIVEDVHYWAMTR